MEDIFNKVTEFKDYNIEASNNYSAYYQIHILSYNKIVSSYYNKEDYDFEDINKKANKLYNSIKNKSVEIYNISLFNTEDIFLITDDKTLIEEDELNEYNSEYGRYEKSNDYEDIFSFLDKTNIDTFIESALITVGAKKMIPPLKTKIESLLKTQNRSREFWEKLNETEKGEPKYIVEVYRIERNYKPSKIQEFKCATLEASYCLPEIKLLLDSDKRITCLIKEIDTGKIIEGSLKEAIESIKFEKWQKRNPTIIDSELMLRMELDNDDPNFINYEDFIANDDELEQGDEDYQPRF
jgi:hypothetical protein